MNSELYDNKYRIPTPIIMKINAKLVSSPDSEGVKRAKNLTKGGIVTYQQLKRLKNFFDHFNPEKNGVEQYELSGGKDMQNWVEETLNVERKKTNISKEVKSPMNTKNQFSLPTANIAKVNEEENKENENEEEKETLELNANVVVVNPEKRFLLLKRSSYEEQWMPNKWSMVGGGIDKGEQPIEAAKRELKEETGIVVDKFKEKFVIQRDNNVEHVFITLYEGDPFNVKLDKENQGFGWFGYNEIKFLDTVPNLMDYINLAIKSYD